MRKVLSFISVSTLITAPAALAHDTVSGSPHLHAGDLIALAALLLAVIIGGALWFGPHAKRARIQIRNGDET